MQKLGQEISRKEIGEMISRHDLRGDGVLSYDEFKQIFLDGENLEIPIDDEMSNMWASQTQKTPQLTTST